MFCYSDAFSVNSSLYLSCFVSLHVFGGIFGLFIAAVFTARFFSTLIERITGQDERKRDEGCVQETERRW